MPSSAIVVAGIVYCAVFAPEIAVPAAVALSATYHWYVKSGNDVPFADVANVAVFPSVTVTFDGCVPIVALLTTVNNALFVIAVACCPLYVCVAMQ